ncbi:outer membrane transport energization protein ExbB [[Leptolyngbya] sp. PCC 7376]|uniref:MotA/TolQ/ExbB proton channel family protein n=1 Tax=[Leptolyngbya] sp. PCC 7376 TaxID=111781 RepID=UPI00029F1A5B|nr:MotA/TolQ/ExbB proton channel family protein [[Leptolyngbya] sp. PCC 7376]AFY38236.1 outer membrane transport energization protein ExbB [[Leptolyngbya] sp. PCC 7376]
MQRLGELIATAGIVAVPLLIFSIVAIALVLERIAFWYRINSQQTKVAKAVLKTYAHDPDAARQRLQRHVNLPMARIFLEALSLEDAEPDELELAISGAIQAEIPVIKRFNNIFDTIIALSPLLGLLGTVLGLIQSFSSIDFSSIGGSESAGVTSGISEALTSTAFGLVVAVFTLFFANTFRGFYLRQLALFQEYTAELELLHRRHHRYGKPEATPEPVEVS